MSKEVSEWAMKHGLIQCMGCRGYGPAKDYSWHIHNKFHGTPFPYCTDECRQKDGAEAHQQEE